MSAADEPLVDVLDSPEAGPAAIRGGALRAGGYMAGILLSLISAPFVVRHLGTVDFGRYTLVLSIIALVAGLTEGGVAAVGLREYTTRPERERDGLMRNLLGVRLVLTVVGVLGALAFTLIAGYDRTLVLGTALAGIGLLLQSMQNLVAVPLAGNLRYGWATVTDLARQIVTVSLTLALVIAGAELLPFLAVSIAGGAVALVMTATLVRGTMPLRPAFDPAEWWLLIRDTLPYAAAIALNVAYFRIAIILMSLVSTETQTGVFSVSFRILEVLLPIPALVIGAVFPIVARAARDDPARLAYATRRLFETAVIVGLWFVLCVELAAPFLVQVLAGSGAGASVPVLRWQGVALLATFVAVGCGFPLLSLHRHRDLLVANGVALVVSVGLTLALVPSQGARGAAIGTTAAEFALALMSAVLLARARAELRPPLAGPGIALLCALLAAAVVLIPGLHEVARAALASVVYFGALTLLGRVPQELIDAIPRLRPAP
jgi:O-antigen/teichoic acid export membrane protein